MEIMRCRFWRLKRERVIMHSGGGITSTFFLANDVIISCFIFKKIINEEDIQELTSVTLNYIKSIGSHPKVAADR